MLNLLLALSLSTAAHAQDITAAEIVQRMDANLVFDTRSSVTTLTVIKGKKVKTYEIDSYGRGTQDAALEFIAPQRDKGTKMLKKGGELWMYMPSIEKTQKISGHMLRQGMMGSDFSYEDMMETTELTKLYKTTLVGDELLGSTPCWKLELTAIEEDTSYPRRVMWVDKAKAIPINQELYASSGRLVKTWAMAGIQEFDGRYYPTAMRIDSAVEAGSYTIAQFNDLTFSIPLEDEVFNRRWLER